MSQENQDSSQDHGTPTGVRRGDQQASNAPVANNEQTVRNQEHGWWIKLLLQPLLILLSGATLFIGLGITQRYGLITSGDHSGNVSGSATTTAARFICPMMCTPPQMEPGRCPVCAMELVPIAADNGNTDSMSVQIAPAARRVANIQTAPVVSMPMARTIQAIGELSYDEGTLRTIAAYVDGRLDRLYADYTGVAVNKGDHLALVYSPRLYSGQVELLLSKQAHEHGQESTLKRVVQSSRDLYHGARQRLIELGMTDSQIKQLEELGEANSRMHLCAPISGTVIEKFAVEGEYVKEGEPIYRLADLSTVWLKLELFPEDAASVRYGQNVVAEVQSLPGRSLRGRVAFIDPTVKLKTRTVSVRVVIDNKDGALRVGDYAKAQIDVPWNIQRESPVFDPDLAKKWISPRHPHRVSDAPGACPMCGVDLIPAEPLGFTDQPHATARALVVPRDAVLMVGNNGVLYVETDPGRFEIRRVILGPEVGDQIVIQDGVSEGEQVATRGNFLIDSQMQLAGNPSLIDPNKVETRHERDGPSEKISAVLSDLPPGDRKLAERQRICPVTELPLGSMGVPPKVAVNGKTVFICCEGCRGSLLREPIKYLAILQRPTATENDALGEMSLPPIGTPQIVETDDELPPITAPQRVADPGTEDMNDQGSLPPFAELPMEVVR